MDDKDENLHPKYYYTDAKGTGVISVMIFGIITIIIMAIVSRIM